MSRTVPATLQTHLNGTVTTLATCWKVIRGDGVVMGFTNHTRDLTVSGVDYKAATGITPSTISASSGLAVDNLEILSVLDSAAITDSDLLAGVYDYAAIQVFLTNYADATFPTVILHQGRLGEVSLKDGQFTAEARSLLELAHQQICGLASVTCRAQALGDSTCKVNLAGNTAQAVPITYNGTVTAVTDNRTFTDSAATQASVFFAFGTVKFTSGLNTGLTLEVKSFSGGVFIMQQQFPRAIGVGDHYTAVAGCDRTRATCGGKFSNILNFQGEPDIPGRDKAMHNP